MNAPDPVTSNDELFCQVYEELRRMARRVNRPRGSLTWNPTALVNEAYVRLAESKTFRAASPEHLKHTTVRAMKYLIVEAARRSSAARRGGGSVPIRRISLDDEGAQSATFDPEQILAVAFALDELSRQDEFQARVFEYQFFGGFQVSEIAALLGVSEKKVQRTLRVARAHLSVALGRGRTE